MMDVETLANLFADGSYDIAGVHRLVIQPKSVLREFKNVSCGFLFVVHGKARFRVDGTSYEMQPGSVLHLAPGMLLDSLVVGQTELEYFTVYYKFHRRDEVRSSDHMCMTHFKLEPGSNPRVAALLIMLQQHAPAAGAFGRMRAKELFLRLIYQVLVGCKHRESDNCPDKQMIEEAVAYIHGHYMAPLTLDDLAELHAMSPKRFSYFFHKYTGFRPIDYVIHYRMERAGELLKSGHYPIRDVSVSVGYANPLYFSRVFKKKFGMSPSEYIRSCPN